MRQPFQDLMNDKVIAGCLSDMADDETCANKQRAFHFCVAPIVVVFTISHTIAPPTVNYKTLCYGRRIARKGAILMISING